MACRVLVLGGYGQFGSRIVEGLSADDDMHVVIAGRDLDKARALAARLGTTARATLEPARVDIEDGIDVAFAALRPDIVIHTAGPFQERDHGVARAALAHGAHYIDLADGRAFVDTFDAVDAHARTAGRWAITGASSVPGISAAVVAAHRDRFAHLYGVEAGISPGNRTARGLATTRAILGYVGRPMRVLRGGRWTTAHGWQSLRRVVFPGVGARWFARCEVPDLSVLPHRHPELRTCEFRAGLELHRMHFGLWLASWAVRAGLVRDLPRHAERLLAISQRWIGLASDSGVMHVDMTGVDAAGTPLALRWSIVARDGEGPCIPATPAIVLARKLARGGLPGSGARACVDFFTLDECVEALRSASIEASTHVLP